MNNYDVIIIGTGAGGGTLARHLRMREKLLSIGDDVWIEDEDGNRA